MAGAVHNDENLVTYGDTNTESVSLHQQAEGIAPGELYEQPFKNGVPTITPSVVDPNIGRFTKGTVPENGIGQPLENTHEGLSLGIPLFTHEEPDSTESEKKDAGLTAVQVARQQIRAYETQKQNGEDDPQDASQPAESAYEGEDSSVSEGEAEAHSLETVDNSDEAEHRADQENTIGDVLDNLSLDDK